MSINGGGFRDIPNSYPHVPLENEVRPVNDALGGIYTPPLENQCPVCNEIVAVGWGSPHFCLDRNDPRVQPNYPARIYHNPPWMNNGMTVMSKSPPSPPLGDPLAIAGVVMGIILSGIFFYRR